MRDNFTARRPTGRSTDLPTVVLHWGLVLALLVSVITGWRIARSTDPNLLLRWIETLLLQGNVLRWHFVSATVLVALVAAYVAFLWRMDLGARFSLRWASLRSPDHQVRWQAINRLIYWMAFAMLLGAAVTGTVVYFAPGIVPTNPLVMVHQWLS
jgi:cytochrome b561